MFWKGKVPFFTQIMNFVKQSEVSLIDLGIPQITSNLNPGNCDICLAFSEDLDGIAKLLNEWFEDKDAKTKSQVTSAWLKNSIVEKKAIWIVAKDVKGTVRGCVSSFAINSPYPNSPKSTKWGIVDWYCVHPLWRSKGLGSTLLEMLDYVTFSLARKAHVFLKEGYPLPFPHVPVFSTWLKCRKAGSKDVKENTLLDVYPYEEVERATGLPLFKIKSIHDVNELDKWETALDTQLPECWVFVTCDTLVNNERGWKTDSLVSMYAFRWSPGKWLGSKPDNSII
jgi:N-acetylglutamate synthase-like GNAT family acetyltransferase